MGIFGKARSSQPNSAQMVEMGKRAKANGWYQNPSLSLTYSRADKQWQEVYQKDDLTLYIGWNSNGVLVIAELCEGAKDSTVGSVNNARMAVRILEKGRGVFESNNPLGGLFK